MFGIPGVYGTYMHTLYVWHFDLMVFHIHMVLWERTKTGVCTVSIKGADGEGV